MPRKEDLKNWKYKECFISDRDGWCDHCPRTWKKGYKIYWMEKPNYTGWAACTDKKCYLEQGGKLTIFKRDEPETETVMKRLVIKDSDKQEIIFDIECGATTEFWNDIGERWIYVSQATKRRNDD